jgi:hypothetical protein
MNRRGFFGRVAGLIAGGVAAKALPAVEPEFTHRAYSGYYTVPSTSDSWPDAVRIRRQYLTSLGREASDAEVKSWLTRNY